MIKELVKLAEHLDKKGLHKEADYVDWLIKQSKDYGGYSDSGYNPNLFKQRDMNLDYMISKDIGVNVDSYKKMFPMGMSGKPNSKNTINLRKQSAPFSYFKDLILKVLNLKGEGEENLDESWCIYSVISENKNKTEITYDLELNTFSCNELWVYLPSFNTPYAKEVNRKALRM